MQIKKLLAWYDQHGRQLPWRDNTEAYAVWVSEIMLQQTQVSTVLPRYQAWMQKFPNIHSLAAASSDRVLKAWEGLGYYRRARWLHESAQTLSKHHNGCFPTDFHAILALKGIGRSTAGAIASICFQQARPVLDGNVKRVLSRWHGCDHGDDKALWQLAEDWISQCERVDTWNQAMMELGARVCKPRKPLCQDCPVQTHCQAPAQKQQASQNITIKDLHWQVQWHQHPQQGLWLQQRPSKGIWANLWSPPIKELTEPPQTEPDLIHRLTHRRLHLYIQKGQQPTGQGQWFKQLDQIALPTGIHRLLQKAVGGQSSVSSKIRLDCGSIPQ